MADAPTGDTTMTDVIETLKTDLAATPAAAAGLYIVPDGWTCGERLDDARSCEGFPWDAALPSATLRGTTGRVTYPIERIEVTGRKLDWATASGRPRVRVRLTFGADGEEPTTTGAWLFLEI